MFLNLESNVLSLLSSNLKIRRTAFTLSYGFLHIYLPTIFNLRKASFHATFQIWCQTGVRFLSTNARTPNFTGLFSLTTSSPGIIFRFKHYHVLSRIYAFSNSLHQCIITHYYVLSFQNSLQFCCKNSFLLHESHPRTLS